MSKCVKLNYILLIIIKKTVVSLRGRLVVVIILIYLFGIVWNKADINTILHLTKWDSCCLFLVVWVPKKSCHTQIFHKLMSSKCF